VPLPVHDPHPFVLVMTWPHATLDWLGQTGATAAWLHALLVHVSVVHVSLSSQSCAVTHPTQFPASQTPVPPSVSVQFALAVLYAHAPSVHATLEHWGSYGFAVQSDALVHSAGTTQLPA